MVWPRHSLYKTTMLGTQARTSTQALDRHHQRLDGHGNAWPPESHRQRIVQMEQVCFFSTNVPRQMMMMVCNTFQKRVKGNYLFKLYLLKKNNSYKHFSSTMSWTCFHVFNGVYLFVLTFNCPYFYLSSNVDHFNEMFRYSSYVIN